MKRLVVTIEEGLTVEGPGDGWGSGGIGVFQEPRRPDMLALAHRGPDSANYTVHHAENLARSTAVYGWLRHAQTVGWMPLPRVRSSAMIYAGRSESM